jgi:hypothetical protein
MDNATFFNLCKAEYAYWSDENPSDDDDMKMIRLGAVGAASNLLAAAMGHPTAWHRAAAANADPASKNGTYIPVPVIAARDVSRAYGKEVVVVIAWDDWFKTFHTATYGISAADKQVAANLGDLLTHAAGASLAHRTTFDDFRTREKAEWAAEKEQLEAKIRDLEAVVAAKGGAQ